MKNIKTAVLDHVIEKVGVQIENAERGRSGAIEESKAHKGMLISRYDALKKKRGLVFCGGYTARLADLNKPLPAQP